MKFLTCPYAVTTFTVAAILGGWSGTTTTCHAQQDIEITWQIQEYEDRTAQVGDTITFSWASGHNVHIHPTGNCTETDAIEVGTESPATYTFTEDDAGQSLFFACDVASHCEQDQHITINVMDNGGNDGGDDGGMTSDTPAPTSAPTGDDGDGGMTSDTPAPTPAPTGDDGDGDSEGPTASSTITREFLGGLYFGVAATLMVAGPLVM